MTEKLRGGYDGDGDDYAHVDLGGFAAAAAGSLVALALAAAVTLAAHALLVYAGVAG